MNRIYKVIYSKARQCAIVVSELAKSSHKNSRKGASHTGTPALARILAAALVAGAVTWGGVPEVSWAADNTTVTDNNGNEVTNTDSKKDINANATVDGGVTLGSDSVASTEAGKTGYDAQGKKHSNSDTDYSAWVSTDAAVSVGGADREVTYDVLDKDGKPVIDKTTGKTKQEKQIVKSTRQITNLAAGTENTDAVNVAQLKASEENLSTTINSTINKKVAVIFDDKGSLKSTDANISHEILQDPGRFPEGEGQSIALGKGAHAYMQGGWKPYYVLFGMKKAAGAIAIGEGSQALSQSIAIGNRTYTGDIGDVNISNYNNFYGNGGAGSGVGSVLLGTNSYTGGTLSTLIGNYSIMSTAYPNSYDKHSGSYTQNAGAVSIGALNSIESATTGNDDSGIANSIVGLANKTNNTNGALIYGAGNTITNSFADVATPGSADSVAEAAQSFRDSVQKNPGGAALAIGGGNKIDKSIRTQTMGVNNEVTGSLYHEDAKYKEVFLGYKILISPEVNEYSSQYNMVDGYNNKVSNTNNAYVIGTNNTILGKTFSADTKDGTLSKADRTKAKESDNLVIIGDNHTMDKDVKNNIVIGTSDKALTTSVSNAVLLGHNADVQNDGGVAVGDGSVAATDKGAVGYDLKGEDHSADTTGTWKSTAAAVSVGNKKKNLTRQITNVAAGTEDTDAVNVAQLKQVSDVINNNINANKVHYYSVKSKYQDDKSNYNNNGAKGQESIVLGIASSSDAGYSTVIGMGSSAKKRGTSQASGMYDTVVGQYLDTTGSYNSVFGTFYQNGSIQQLTRVYGDRNTVLGAGNIVGIGKNNTKVKSDENVVIGLNNSVEGSGSIIVGNATTVNGPATMNATSLGHVNHIYDQLDGGGQWGVALGNNLTVKGEYALAVGNNSTAQGDETVAVGYNANASVAGGVAIGSGSEATVTGKSTEGYDPTTGQTSTDTTGTWQATKAAVSIGKADGTVTRQINGVAAGTNDTDAVNVAQLKKLEGMKANVDASNIGKNLKGADGKTAAADAEKTTNENAWGEALGTGTVTKDSKQLVTGSTVYNEVRPSKDGKYVKMSQTTGENLLNLDSQVQTNTDKLSDVDSRSVKYDTKTVNDKTVVDNSKITLAGEGGTTITNLKDGVNANDAATMGQLNDRISGVTYKAGDGIKYGTDADNNKTISVNKGDGLKFTEDHKLAVNTGKHLSVNTDGQIDVGDNGAVAENDGNLVTGDTVYKALNGGMTKMIIGTPGKNGKDGTPGTIGLVGPAGTNGQDGAVDITIQKGEDGKDGKDGIKGANGVDGKDGINRIVYEDKNGKHQVATMEDGLKFAGDDGQNDATKAIAKKLNNTVDIIGGADSTKLTANNIGVNNVDGKLKIQLAKNLAGITSIANQTTTGKGDAQTTTGAKIDLKDDGSISVNSGKITDVKSGLTATDGTYADTDKNNAANIGDVHSMIEKEAGNTDDKLALKANVAADNIGTHITDTTAQKTNLDNWGEAIGTGKIADPDASDKETNGSKQLVTGGTVYNEVRPSKDGKYVKMSQTTGDNLLKLDDQVKQNAQNISDNTYTQGDGILMDKTKKTISVNKGDGLKFTEDHKLAVYTGNGLKIDNGAVAIKTSDSNLKVDSNGIGLSDKITIGSDKTKQVTIDGTNGEISGLTNTTWDSKADYSKSTKAATESQVDAAVKDAVKQAGENDIHVAAGSYAVNDQNQVSMNLVDKNNDTKGTVIITDVAKSSEMGDVSKLADGVKNAGGKTTTVVDAINNVNENVNSVDRKVGDLNYFEQNDGKTHTVTNGTSITKAIGDLDSAVQNATEQAGKHTIVSTKDTNLDVKNIAKDGEAANYQIALNQDLNVNTVTAKTVTTDNLTVNKSATIGGVTIANKTISGLDDTKIEKGSTNAVNAGTIWNELRPSGGTYINQNNTTAQNLTSLDTQVKKTSDLINSDGKTIKIGGSDAATKIDVNGKDGKGRVITGVVSDANDPTSAANVGYVNGVTAANTQQIYRDMNNAYGRLNNNINKAAAGSNALAALHPLDYDPDDKADFAVGYGHYRNANAAAVGAFYHPNENTMVNVGVSLGNGDPGFNAGVSFKVGRGGAGREAMSKTEMAKVINSQSKEIDALKKDNADKDKRIDALEQKMAEILAKLDKNGK